MTTAHGRLALVSVALAAVLVMPASISASGDDDGAQLPMDVKAAFLYNFAKFTEWPGMAAGGRISACVVGDDELLSAFAAIAGGREINGHAFDFTNRAGPATWPQCHLLFIAAAGDRPAAGLAALKSLPVLTVSDVAGFAKSGGMIELYLEGGRMRFAINVDAVTRSGLRVSSRLLELAKIVRDGHGQ